MKTELNIKLSATLDKNALECIIKEALEEETGKKVASISFTISEMGNERMGCGYNEVTGCTVTFENGPIKPKIPTGPIPRGTTRC